MILQHPVVFTGLNIGTIFCNKEVVNDPFNVTFRRKKKILEYIVIRIGICPLGNE